MQTNTLTFEIIGRPIAQKRPRFARHGAFVQTYSDQETEAGRWIAEMCTQLKKCDHVLPIPSGIPVTIEALFIFPVLSRFSRKCLQCIDAGEIVEHVSRPDADNCLKWVKDCLSKGVVYHDDAQVWECIGRKYYGMRPKTIVTVTWRTAQ